MLDLKEVAYTYDDITLEPRFSRLEHRSDVDLSTTMGMKIPVISSPMDTVTGSAMAKAMSDAGGKAYLHRYNTIEEQVNTFHNSTDLTGCAIGTSKDYKERLQELIRAGCVDFCVDVANTDVLKVLKAIIHIRDATEGMNLTAGNCCTVEAFARLCDLGVNAVRVGIGGGSACTTRVRCGVGVPNVTALMNIAVERYWNFPSVTIIADGGVRTSGDAVKALACGADSVMLGGYLAGSSATPGGVFVRDNRKVKVYRGMASKEALKSRDSGGSNARPGSVEGESMNVRYKGETLHLLDEFTAGIRAGMAYLGCPSIEALHNAPIGAYKVTSSGRVAATAHRKLSE